jgi:acyl carrier protein
MDTAEIQQRVIQILTDRLGMSRAEITPEARLVDDLGLDSLDAAELAIALEGQFDVSISDEQVAQLKTVADLLAMVAQITA